MSVYYLVRERFSSSKSSQSCDEAWAVKQQLQRHISQLFARQLCVTDGISPVHGISLCMTLDGETVEYKAEREALISLDIQASLKKLAVAIQVELDLSYGFIWNFGDDLLEEGPFSLSEYLDNCPDEVFSCCNYVMHNHADSNPDASGGIISVYGKRKGQLFKGMLPFEEISTLPAFGHWHALDTALMIEDAAIKDGQYDRVGAICDALMAMSQADEIDMTNGFLLLNINDLSLKNPDQLQRFIDLTQELLGIIKPDRDDYFTEWFLNTELLDESRDGPNLLNIRLSLDGRLVLSLADARMDRLGE